jgi:cell division septum initiation protein DivIVA
VSSVTEQSSTPQFAHAVRGYDRLQVDEYVERLREWGMEAHARADESERRMEELEDELGRARDRVQELEAERPGAPEAVKVAAERAAAAVSEAVQQAAEIRRRATEDADRLLEDARRQALDIVEAARQSLTGLSEEARQERAETRRRAEAILDEAGREAEEIRRRAQDEADHVVSGGRELAARLVSEAEDLVQAVRDRGAAERYQAEEALDRLRDERTRIVAELARLRGAIHALIDGDPGGGPEHAKAAGPAADQPVEGEPDETVEMGSAVSAPVDEPA